MMNGFNEMLELIKANNSKISRDNVKSVLIIYEEKELFIGDSCIIFDKFKACKLFFPNASVDIHFNIKTYVDCYSALLKCNPYIDNIRDLTWEEIDYSSYDLVICVTHQEEALLKIISERHKDDFLSKTFRTAICSFSLQLVDDLQNEDIVFPFYEELFEFSRGHLGPMELYVSDEERLWANTWLTEKGLKENEKLLILLDSTSVRSKLLGMTVYYEMLTWLLKLPDIKILIFDENNIGKQEFYNQLLGRKQTQKFIFSNGLDLRKAITLLSADKVKLIFGPCTGLMHCASGLYNNFVRAGLSPSNVPLLITYTGKYHKAHESANYWWHNAPLMNCMIIRKKNGIKEMVSLNELTEQEKNTTEDTLPCAEYTSAMLIGFLTKNLKLSDG
jgi:ADP-heptose:LPS heptosyltransferase